MTKKRFMKKRSEPRNEWLSLVEAIDELMAQQATQESPKEGKPVIARSFLTAVNAAYAATLRSYTILLEGGTLEPGARKQISRLWQKAGEGLRKYDAALASRLKASNSFWSNDVTWNKETIQKAWAGLNSIRVNANMMDPDVTGIRRWSTFSAS
jgi:hypothetical protein